MRESELREGDLTRRKAKFVGTKSGCDTRRRPGFLGSLLQGRVCPCLSGGGWLCESNSAFRIDQTGTEINPLSRNTGGTYGL